MYEIERASDYPGFDGPSVANGYLEPIEEKYGFTVEIGEGGHGTWETIFGVLAGGQEGWVVRLTSTKGESWDIQVDTLAVDDGFGDQVSGLGGYIYSDPDSDPHPYHEAGEHCSTWCSPEQGRIDLTWAEIESVFIY